MKLLRIRLSPTGLAVDFRVLSFESAFILSVSFSRSLNGILVVLDKTSASAFTWRSSTINCLLGFSVH